MVAGRVSVSRFDLGFRFDCKFLGSVFMWAALISAVVNKFAPSYFTEVFLWCSVNCFIWESTKK